MYKSDMNRDTLTTEQAAERLGVTPVRVRAMITAKRLPAEKFGRDYVILEADLRLVEDRKPGRPPKQATAAPPRTEGAGRRADKTSQKLGDAFGKAAESEQQAGRKKGGKK